MQIKFLTTFQNKDGSERNLAAAQGFLLQDWYKAIHENNIKFISKAKLEFDIYDFYEYEDQEKLISAIRPYYEGLIMHVRNKDLTFEKHYENLSKEYRLMELTITIDEEVEYINDYWNSDESEGRSKTEANEILFKVARGCSC